MKVMLSEEDVRAKYPWDYRELCRRMAARYRDFKQDGRFHALRKPLLSDERYAKARYLDPGNLKSPKKDFYNPNVLSVFDASYRRAKHRSLEARYAWNKLPRSRETTMKFGMRTPSLKRMISARTSPARFVRHNLGFKAPRGWGWLTNPKKAAYNRVYSRTTFSFWGLLKALFGGKR